MHQLPSENFPLIDPKRKHEKYFDLTVSRLRLVTNEFDVDDHAYGKTLPSSL
jgi:hypothetical protein